MKSGGRADLLKLANQPAFAVNSSTFSLPNVPTRVLKISDALLWSRGPEMECSHCTCTGTNVLHLLQLSKTCAFAASFVAAHALKHLGLALLSIAETDCSDSNILYHIIYGFTGFNPGKKVTGWYVTCQGSDATSILHS